MKTVLCEPAVQIRRTASFSRCGQYRYQLSRRWQSGVGRCVFIGLNPSTADVNKDDPTIRRCMGFAHNWGYQEMIMVNLFAFRTPDPSVLKACSKPVGQSNRRAVRRACESADLIVVAWGAHGTYRDQARKWSSIWSSHTLLCFGTTRSNQPLHPLYQRRDAALVKFMLR